MDSDKILVLGIGNYLMGDEGVGVHFANYLLSQDLPKNVDVLDGGTGGFYLTNYIESYPIVILIDATLDDKTPGSTRLLEPHFSKDYPKVMSTHDIGMKDLIEAMIFMGTLPKIYLFAVSINSLQQQQVHLTQELEAILPELRDKVFALVERLRKPVAV
ncbi:MAG: hydrogenase maturation protease [Saprospiraceae bacterium]